MFTLDYRIPCMLSEPHHHKFWNIPPIVSIDPNLHPAWTFVVVQAPRICHDDTTKNTNIQNSILQQQLYYLFHKNLKFKVKLIYTFI